MTGRRLRVVPTVMLVITAFLAIVPSASAAIASTPTSTWQTNGRVLAIVNLNGVTYIGGTFTQVMDHNGHTLAVSNLAAIDSSGNAISTWTPQANKAVNALATNGTTIIAGGAFTRIDGKSHKRLAEISTSGAVLAWKVQAGAAVQALAVSGSTLYFGGTFTTVNTLARAYMAAADLGTGALSTTWTPTADGRVDALAADGTRVIAGGFFQNVNGSAAKYLAALDPATGASLPWTTRPLVPVLGIEESAGTVYTAQGGAGGKVAAYSTGGTFIWGMQTDGNVETVAVAGGELVAGGHFNNFCDWKTNCTNPVARQHIAALDLTTGAIDPNWAPSLNSILGDFTLTATATNLYLGGDFTTVNGVDQEHFADLAIT